MKTADSSLINSYFSLLKSLSPNAKLELIAKLSQSMKTNRKATKDRSWKLLFGALELEMPIENFVNDMKKDRKFTRKSIDL
jgi:hypothetical protein